MELERLQEQCTAALLRTGEAPVRVTVDRHRVPALAEEIAGSYPITRREAGHSYVRGPDAQEVASQLYAGRVMFRGIPVEVVEVIE